MNDNLGNLGDFLPRQVGGHADGKNSNFGRLGDFLPQKEMKCRVRGCNNLVHLSGNAVMQDIAHGRRPERMCEECFARLQTLQDKEMPCSKPGCNGTWTWNRYQQLESLACGHKDPPRGFCSACQEELKNVKDQQIPCRMKGCKNTWTLTAREQAQLGGRPIPHKLCDDCFQKLKSLEDREVKCRVPGCDHTFTWNRFQQLEHLKAGKSLDNPPQRMCDRCFHIFSALVSRELPCRIHDCKNTWTFSSFEQLQQIVKALSEGKTAADVPGSAERVQEILAAKNGQASDAHPKKQSPQDEETAKAKDTATAEPESAEAQPTSQRHSSVLDGLPIPPPPSRMCKDCFSFYNSATDLEQPCRNHFCKNTWKLTKSMQLSLHVRKRTNIIPRYCEACEAKLKELADKDMPCSQPGCDGSWLYRKEDQLRDLTAGHPPKPHLCLRCNEFIKSHPAKDVQCQSCGALIQVSSRQQLECELGVSTLPTLCSDCTKKSLDSKVDTDAVANSIVRPVLAIPRSGEWTQVPGAKAPPPRLTAEKIAAAEKAVRRIVCVGDELTLSGDNEETSWPMKLQTALSEKYGEQTLVLNAAMPACTATVAKACVRRDIAPFAPQVVIVSTVFSDTLAIAAQPDEEARAAKLAELFSDSRALLESIQKTGAKPVAWLPHPIYFEESPEWRLNKGEVSLRKDLLRQVTNQFRGQCEELGITLVDVGAMFLSTGEKMAHEWMDSWELHNETGASNIANWLKNSIIENNFLADAVPFAAPAPAAPEATAAEPEQPASPSPAEE